MGLFILTIKRPVDRSLQEWFFDDHKEYMKARRAAEHAGIFVDGRSDMWTDAMEFINWLEDERIRLDQHIADGGREHGA